MLLLVLLHPPEVATWPFVLPSSIPQASYTLLLPPCRVSPPYARCCLFCLCLFSFCFFFGFICKRNMNKTNEFSLQSQGVEGCGEGRCWLFLFCKFLVSFTVTLHLKLAAFTARVCPNPSPIPIHNCCRQHVAPLGGRLKAGNATNERRKRNYQCGQHCDNVFVSLRCVCVPVGVCLCMCRSVCFVCGCCKWVKQQDIALKLMLT